MLAVAHGEAIRDPDRRLRADVRLVGEVLGHVIREQEGKPLYALVERMRLAAIALRHGAEPGDERQVRCLLAQLDLDEIVRWLSRSAGSCHKDVVH